MLKNGFIVIHRKIVEWEWYKNHATFIVFIHLLLTANYKPQKFEGELIKVGERVASYASLAEETGLSVQQVRTAIKNLKSTGDLTSRSNNKYTVFTIVNYSQYQSRQQAKQQTTNKRLTSTQQTTNNNETIYNKANKEKQYKAAPAADFELHDPGATDF